MKRIFLVVLSLLLPMTALAQSEVPPYVIVSDIDDTIQKTQIHWKSNPLAFVGNLFRFHDAFVGMPALYNALAGQGLPFHYVTGAPRMITRLPEKFLQVSGFPAGGLWTRPSNSVPTEEFKVRQVAELMRAYPDSKFILIGDNGERDVHAYERIQKDPVLGPRVALTFIHRLYAPGIGSPLAENQKPYVSTAEITLDLRRAGLLSESMALGILQQVERGLLSRFRSVERLTIPEFAVYDGEAVLDLAKRAESEHHPEIRRLILSIASWMNERLPVNQRARLPAKAFFPPRPALCSKILG